MIVLQRCQREARKEVQEAEKQVALEASLAQNHKNPQLSKENKRNPLLLNMKKMNLPNLTPESSQKMKNLVTERERAYEEETSDTELAKKLILESFQEETRKKRGIVFNETSLGVNDGDEDQPKVSPLVDKRKLKCIIVNTRTERAKEQKDLLEASKISRYYQQPHSYPVILPRSEGGTSST